MSWTLIAFLWLGGMNPQDQCTTLPTEYVQKLHFVKPAGREGTICVRPNDLKRLQRGERPTYKLLYNRY
jgi:hypothetical protein